jgi:hypothetical protein
LEEQTTRSAITFTSIMEAIAVRKWFYQYISKIENFHCKN